MTRTDHVIDQECMNVAEQAIGALEYVATLGTERRRRESK